MAANWEVQTGQVQLRRRGTAAGGDARQRTRTQARTVAKAMANGMWGGKSLCSASEAVGWKAVVVIVHDMRRKLEAVASLAHKWAWGTCR